MRWNVRFSTTAGPALALGLASTLLLSGCGSSDATDDSGVQVVTSTNVYADLAATIGGKDVEVTSFISSPDQDPHSYEANSRNILTVSKADVVIKNGGGYDDFMDQMLDGSDADPTVINAVDVAGLTAPAGGELNEHAWYDLPSMQKVSLEIAKALGAADPDHAGRYDKNAASLNDDIQTLIDREAALKQTIGGAGVGITEPVPLYMLDALGLDNLTPGDFSEAIEEGDDISVSVLDETLSLYTDHKAKALVYNEQTSGPSTEQVKAAADDAGIPGVPVAETLPAGDTYITWMADNLDNLQKALSEG